MKYRFLLTVESSRPAVFRFPSPSVEVLLDDGPPLSPVARNAETLVDATQFIFDGRGFSDDKEARIAGERLRLRLRALNAILNLGLRVPLTDATSSRLSDEVREAIKKDHGVTFIDGIFGLHILPDDDEHFQFVIAGHMSVYPSDPYYSLKALASLWNIEMSLDQQSEDALAILGLASAETSSRAAFLTTYLAAESLIIRQNRSEAACALLKGLERQVRDSGLPPGEIDSLRGNVAALQVESFPSALWRLVDRIASPREWKGQPIREFLSLCIRTRNLIAHKAELDRETKLTELTDGLREFVLTLIWTTNGIPNFTASIPPSKVEPLRVQIKAV